MGIDEVEGTREMTPSGVANGIGPRCHTCQVMFGVIPQEVLEEGLCGVGDEVARDVCGCDVAQACSGDGQRQRQHWRYRRPAPPPETTPRTADGAGRKRHLLPHATAPGKDAPSSATVRDSFMAAYNEITGGIEVGFGSASDESKLSRN